MGRGPALSLTLPCVPVSRSHAEIYGGGDRLHLRDLGSSNGTFLNGQLITDCRLVEGDLLHFADFEFRLGRRGPDPRSDAGPDDMPRTASLPGRKRPRGVPEGARGLRELSELGAG